MEKIFKVKDYKGGKLVQFRLPLNNRHKLLHLIYALYFLTGTILFILLMIYQWEINIGAFIFGSMCVVAFFSAFHLFIIKATEIEKIFINKEDMEIISISLFTRNKSTYLLTEISDFKFIENTNFQKDLLIGKSLFDFGSENKPQVIEDLHNKGRISFIYKGNEIRFGKGLMSWEFNKLEVLLYDITGNDFRYTDKFEAEYFPNS